MVVLVKSYLTVLVIEARGLIVILTALARMPD